jgi:hypothetical protein
LPVNGSINTFPQQRNGEHTQKCNLINLLLFF